MDLSVSEKLFKKLLLMFENSGRIDEFEFEIESTGYLNSRSKCFNKICNRTHTIRILLGKLIGRGVDSLSLSRSQSSRKSKKEKIKLVES